MNLLLDILPESVDIDGKEYFVDTDFRTFIIFEKVMDDAEVSAREKVHDLLSLCYTNEMPSNIEAALDRLLWLYSCGDIPQSHRAKKNGDVIIKQPQIYDFQHDAPYIYGAFLSQYGIDLNDIEYLHWWKFQAMFRSLNSDNKIVEIMGYRAADLSKISNQSERNRIAHLKRIYDLPNNLTFEDKVANAGASFGGAF